MSSKTNNKAWSDFYRIKKQTQKEYAKGDMTPNAYTKRVKPALDKALSIPNS